MPETAREGFAIVPLHLLGSEDAPGLTANEIAVYVAVRSYYPNPYPSHAALAKRAGMSVSTLQRTLSGMKAKGVLDWQHQHRDKGGQTSNRYELSDEPTRQPDRPVGQDDRPPRSNRPTPPVKMTDELNKGELERSKGKRTRKTRAPKPPGLRP